MSDVWVCIIETTNEDTGLRMNSQVGLVRLIVTSGPCQGDTCKENGYGSLYKHFEWLQELEDNLQKIERWRRKIDFFFRFLEFDTWSNWVYDDDFTSTYTS